MSDKSDLSADVKDISDILEKAKREDCAEICVDWPSRYRTGGIVNLRAVWRR